MKHSEIIAYNYLLSIGYRADDIKFRSHISPDFITSDGMAWECKSKDKKGKIRFSLLQHCMHPDTQILIVDKEGNIERKSFMEVSKICNISIYEPKPIIKPNILAYPNFVYIHFRIPNKYEP